MESMQVKFGSYWLSALIDIPYGIVVNDIKKFARDLFGECLIIIYTFFTENLSKKNSRVNIIPFWGNNHCEELVPTAFFSSEAIFYIPNVLLCDCRLCSCRLMSGVLVCSWIALLCHFFVGDAQPIENLNHRVGFPSEMPLLYWKLFQKLSKSTQWGLFLFGI